MIININQFETQDNSFPINKVTLLQGAKASFTGLALYSCLKLCAFMLLSLKEFFFPELLDIEERLDFEQAELEWELADLRADCIGPFEATKVTFITLYQLYQLSKLIELGKLTGVNQAIKERLEQMKERLFSLFKTQQESPETLRSISILDEIDQFTTQLESGLENPSRDKIRITTIALELVNSITPYTAITNIVTITKILSELKKPLANNTIRNISPKVFKTAGYIGKLVTESTVGKVFSNAALITGSLLGIVNSENAA